MFEYDFNASWYERRWLTPVAAPVPGPVGRLLRRLRSNAMRVADSRDTASWRIPPL